jgi:protocatechuate 3,4-dioxygenase beta subunit
MSAPNSEPAGAPVERVELQASPEKAPAVEPAPTREGTSVTGRVVDASGAAVGGARVLGMSIENRAFVGMPLDAQRGLGGFGGRKLESTTDSSGRFTLAGVRPGNFRLAVRASRYSPHDDDSIVVPAGDAHDVGTVSLLASPIVEGRVVDPRGRGVADVEIGRVPATSGAGFVFFDGFRQPSVPLVRTGADGSFTLDQLPAGEVTLAVTSESYPDKNENLELPRAGEHIANKVIVLEPGLEIAGRAVGVPASSASELRVLAAVHRERSAGVEDLDFVTGETRQAKVAADGSFTLRGLRENKSYDLTLRRSSDEEPLMFQPRLSSRVTALSGSRGVELPYQPESGITLTVVDARTRQPIEKYELAGGIDYAMPVMEDGGERNQHPEGRGRVGGMRPRPNADRAQVEVKATGYEPFRQEGIFLVEGADVDLGVVALDPVPTCRVTVLDAASGAPVSAARVTLRLREEPVSQQMGQVAMRAVSIAHSNSSEDLGDVDFNFDDDRSHSGRTDANGVVELSSFPGQVCELVVNHRGHASHLSDPFTCAVGARDEREVRLSEGGSVRVTLLRSDGSPIAGGKVEHSSASDGPGDFDFGAGREVTDAQGQCVFTHLAAGTHRFRPEGSGMNGMFGGGNMVVSIAGMPDEGGESWVEAIVTEGQESSVQLVAPIRVTLSGKVTEGGTVLSGAEVSLAPKREDGLRMPRMMFPGSGPSAKTDGRGLYSLPDVKSGEYVLSVTHSTRQMPAEFTVVVGESDKDFDVDLDISVIEGRVTGYDGKPIAGARVRAERGEGRGGTRVRGMRMIVANDDNGDGGMTMFSGDPSSVEVRTDDDGRYALRGVLTSVDLVVSAESKGLQPARSEALQVAPNEIKRGVDLRLDVAGRVEVTAFKAGAPASMVIVMAFPEGANPGHPDAKTGFIQQDGKTTLGGLKPGRWTVQARNAGFGGPGSAPETPIEQTIEVRANEATPVRFDL